ncbi:hypothetical protein [Streptomyces sp. NPDC020681]|uniref:hypothetical protein n=1 Tax=Streptomyces sp. NPDC020681 TaxID=3365083 RepID=UPI0037ACA329
MTPLPPASRTGIRPLRSWAVWTAGFLSFPIAGLAGIGVDKQFTVFGATGALVFSGLSGVLLYRLLPTWTPEGATR